jgi:hypothetical protein
LSRRELIKIFAETKRKKGLQAGDEHFSEFANILFLKIIGEIEYIYNKNMVAPTLESM